MQMGCTLAHLFSFERSLLVVPHTSLSDSLSYLLYYLELVCKSKFPFQFCAIVDYVEYRTIYLSTTSLGFPHRFSFAFCSSSTAFTEPQLPFSPFNPFPPPLVSTLVPASISYFCYLFPSLSSHRDSVSFWHLCLYRSVWLGFKGRFGRGE